MQHENYDVYRALCAKRTALTELLRMHLPRGQSSWLASLRKRVKWERQIVSEAISELAHWPQSYQPSEKELERIARRSAAVQSAARHVEDFPKTKNPKKKFQYLERRTEQLLRTWPY